MATPPEEVFRNPAATINQALDEEQERLRLMASEAAPKDPEIAGRVMAVGARTKLPREVIEQDLPNLEAQLEAREFNYDEYLDTPIFREYAFNNPYALAVVKKDLEALPAYERHLNRLFMGFRAGSAETEMAEIYTRRVRGDEREGDQERLDALEIYDVDHDFGAATGIGRMFVAHAHQAAIMKSLGVEGMVYGAAGAVMGAAAGVAVGGVGAIAGAKTGFSVGFTVGSAGAAYELETGLAYKEYIEAGFNEEHAAAAANSVGVINAAFEAIGFGAVARFMPGFRAVKGSVARQLGLSIWGKPSVRGAYSQFVREFGTALSAELVTEVIQESVTAMGQEYLKRQRRAEEGDIDPTLAPMTWDEWTGLAEQIIVETLKGAVFFAGAGPASGILSNQRRARAAKEAEIPYRAMGEAVNNSTTREKVPEVWREYLQKLEDDGPVKHIMIDRAQFEQYWESQQVNPVHAAKELGIDLESLGEQEASIRVPLAVFTEKIVGTQHYNGLIKDIRIREDEFTIRESEAWEADKDNQIAEIEKVLADTHDTEVNEEVYEDVLQRMLAEGAYDRGAAEKMARLNAAIFTNKAAELKVDPAELWKSRFRGLQVEGSQALQRKDVDIVLDPLIQQLRSGQVPKQREIFGASLLEEARARGGLRDEGGELAALDLAKLFPGLVRPEKGLSLDAAAEWAFESGYIAAYDENLFLDAVRREAQGDPVHSPGQLNEALMTQSSQLDTLYDFITANELDLDKMSNAEVRAKLLEGREFEQGFDQEGLEELTRLIVESGEWTEVQMDRAKALLDTVSDEQALGEAALEEQVKLAETGEVKTVSRKLQVDWDRQVKRRKTLNQLKGCLA